ncbi:MAG: 2-C-methyl-D-erythritol 2,4-cyclodiphosphate synthase [Gammaproteobacteria bacterium]|nr:2-C-methyl-D-erythritol 2,4-cyclodiphosphate synthase [Gammaproteobacteria bacterium]
MRIGHGFDAHKFETGRPLILGGIDIDYHRGMAAHSDGDVVIHALCDALLGAAALGDIGVHFPPSDDSFKNIDSRLLLKQVMAMLSRDGFAVGNADLTIVAEAPKLANHLPKMKELLAGDLNIEPAQLNVKATTTEKMGYTGRGEGVSVHAVVLLV